VQTQGVSDKKGVLLNRFGWTVEGDSDSLPLTSRKEWEGLFHIRGKMSLLGEEQLGEKREKKNRGLKARAKETRKKRKTKLFKPRDHDIHHSLDGELEKCRKKNQGGDASSVIYQEADAHTGETENRYSVSSGHPTTYQRRPVYYLWGEDMRGA